MCEASQLDGTARRQKAHRDTAEVWVPRIEGARDTRVSHAGTIARPDDAQHVPDSLASAEVGANVPAKETHLKLIYLPVLPEAAVGHTALRPAAEAASKGAPGHSPQNSRAHKRVGRRRTPPTHHHQPQRRRLSYAAHVHSSSDLAP